MFNWDSVVNEQHRQELIREAEREQLAREFRIVNGARRYNPTLAWVGRRMMTFGKTLVTLSGEDKQYRPDISLN